MTIPNDSKLTTRPPIVAVLGHVDHGKSSLLDYIRKSNIVEGEAGGITQHAAAYEVEHPVRTDGSKEPTSNGTGEEVKRITFIDTPGHAAFKTIRARGASIADIAILIVAADDGVKAQTLEALESIKRSGIPLIVAINKIDKPNADVERTKISLSENEVYLEGMGGDVPWAAISAKAGDGVPELLDLVLLVAEMQEFTGNPDKPAEGFVMEAHREAKRGIAATLIITDGSMRAGEFVLAGRACAPLRIMCDHMGAALKEATFSTPVTIIGFDELPQVGAPFRTHKSKKEAEASRPEKDDPALAALEGISEDEHIIPLVIKADVAGSLEAVEFELSKIPQEHARIVVVQRGIGDISERDIKAACAADGALVVGFNVGVDSAAEDLARQHGIVTENFSIIYELTERVEKYAKEHTPKRSVEEKIGRARVLKHFSATKNAQLIGARVLDGEIRTKLTVRVLRKNEPVGVGVVETIQTGRQNVERASADTEFGAQIGCDFDILEGDVLECFETREE